MSAEKKPARFGSLKALGRPALEPAPAKVSSNVLEPFSSHLMGDTKARLKQAAAIERRKQYETVEQAVLEYLSRHHPEL